MRVLLALSVLLISTAAYAQSVRVGIGGMTCEPCATTVKASLEMLPSVKEADVRVKTGEAVLTLRDANNEPTDAEVKAAVERAGYKFKGVVR